MPTRLFTAKDGRPFTPELNRELSRRPQPNKRRAIIAITKMQVGLLKCFNCFVEEEGKERPILRDVKPSELAATATAWDRLEARRAIIAGQGPPKPVQAANDPARQATPIDVTPKALTDDHPA